MKICLAKSRIESRESRAKDLRAPKFCPRLSTLDPRPISAFTLVEIAISLAIIGIALVAIIGVLPRGLDVQRENRERTVINRDATIFMEAIRNGARGADDLTNYVYMITNAYVLSGNNVWTNFTSGADIVGLLSTPEFISPSSNHMIAYVRSISGPAVEKPPQDNQIIQQDSFAYELVCENVPVQTASAGDASGGNLQANLHELRLTFLWPILPNGQLPTRPARQTFRTLIAGKIVRPSGPGPKSYFFQSQTFTTSTNVPSP